MLEEFARLIPDSLKEKSGSVFYSGRNAFEGKKDLYILGLNPGGSDVEQRTETIYWHTNQVLLDEDLNFSEYKDGVWNNKKPGSSGLQPRILHLLNKLNLSPYNVPASNICFVRSPREKNISKKINEYIDLCWSFHQSVIDKLEVKVILCFGKTAGNTVKNKIKANFFVDEFIERNNRKWKSQVFKNKNNQFVVIATHPSIADWTNINTDISDLVKKYLPSYFI